jgi:hypothetical protein
MREVRARDGSKTFEETPSVMRKQQMTPPDACMPLSHNGEATDSTK